MFHILSFLKRYSVRILLVVFFCLLLGSYAKIFAIGSPYAPGSTLDPACSPGEVNCTVVLTGGSPSSTTSLDIVADSDTNGSGSLNFKIGSSTKMILDSNGRVGIGTTSPTAKLSIVGVNGGEANFFSDIQGDYDNFTINIPDTGNAFSGDASFYLNPEEGLNILAGSGRISFTPDGGFEIANDMGNSFWVDPNRNVGIGTTTPGSLLTVAGMGSFDSININNASDAFGSNFVSNNGYFVDYVYSPVIGMNGDNGLTGMLSDSSVGTENLAFNVADTNMMTIRGDGVGINTSNPGGVFKVQGVPGNSILFGGNTSGGGFNPFSVSVSDSDEFGSVSFILDPEVGSSLQNTSVSGDMFNRFLISKANINFNDESGLYGFFSGTSNWLKGNVGIGITTAPTNRLHVVGASGDTTVVKIATDGGNTCNFSTITGSFGCASDVRLKNSIAPISGGTALSKLNALNPVLYHYNWQSSSDPLVAGFIAQEYETIFPELTTQNNDGYKMINQALTPYLVKAIQEMDIKISMLSVSSTPPSHDRVFEFFTNIITRIADGIVYITNIFADKITTKTLCVADENGAETCITKSQLDQLLQGVPSQSGQESIPQVLNPSEENLPSDSNDSDVSTGDTQVPSVDSSSEENNTSSTDTSVES